MKAIVKEIEKKEPKIEFPCLMRNPVTYTIILATGVDADNYYLGVVVYAQRPTNYSLGATPTSGSWSTSFEVFDGSVTLSND